MTRPLAIWPRHRRTTLAPPHASPHNYSRRSCGEAPSGGAAAGPPTAGPPAAATHVLAQLRQQARLLRAPLLLRSRGAPEVLHAHLVFVTAGAARSGPVHAMQLDSHGPP